MELKSLVPHRRFDHSTRSSFFFQAVTLREKPFVYAEPVASPDECGTKNEILCPLFNTSSNGKITLVVHFVYKPSDKIYI